MRSANSSAASVTKAACAPASGSQAPRGATGGPSGCPVTQASPAICSIVGAKPTRSRHGPVNPKRRRELQTLFGGSSAGLVYVTAFLDRKTMVKYLGDISWETEVWVADAPDHMIHFNGERFLGPY